MRPSVLQPIDEALRRTKELLFTPFDSRRWLGLTTSLFLATIALNVQTMQVWVTELSRIWRVGREQAVAEAVERGLRELQPQVLLGGLVGVLILWALTWLSTRGVFMFLDNVLRGHGDVLAPWRRYRAHANSLTRLRFVVTLATGIALALVGITWTEPVWRSVRATGLREVDLWQVVGAALVTGIVALIAALVDHVLTEFVAPLMYLHNVRAWPATWYFLTRLLLAYPGSFVLFYIVSGLLWVAALALVAVVSLASCCVCCCALALPYLNMLVLLPVFVFFRYYSVCFLAQCGPACDVFRLAGPPASEQA